MAVEGIRTIALTTLTLSMTLLACSGDAANAPEAMIDEPRFTLHGGFTAPGVTDYTDPVAYTGALTELATPVLVDFDDLDASPVNNSTEGRPIFNGATYSNRGITFANPFGLSLFIAPGGLFWNESNSLSVDKFPFEGPNPTDDDLVVTLKPPAQAVGFTLVENGPSRTDEVIQFSDASGVLLAELDFPADFTTFRAFIGIISTAAPIASVSVVEAPDDADDVNFDDFVFSVTSQQRIMALTAQIDELVSRGSLTADQAAGLRDKLAAIEAKIVAGNSRAAANQIRAFTNQVSAMIASRRLSAEEGQALVEAAELLLAQI